MQMGDRKTIRQRLQERWHVLAGGHFRQVYPRGQSERVGVVRRDVGDKNG